jgi:hypothetical protein
MITLSEGVRAGSGGASRCCVCFQTLVGQLGHLPISRSLDAFGRPDERAFCGAACAWHLAGLTSTFALHGRDTRSHFAVSWTGQ